MNVVAGKQPKVLSPEQRRVARARLWNVYEGLSTRDQTVVQMLSVAYEPVNQGILLACLDRIDLRADNGKSFRGPALEPVITALVRAGVVVEKSRTVWQCHELLVELATRSAVREKQF